MSLLDSALHIVDTTKNPARKIENLYILSYEYGLINPELGIKYGRQCLDLARAQNDLRSQLNAYNGIGNSFETMGNYDSALHYHQLSFEIAKKAGSKYNLVATSFNVANCYKELGDYHRALNRYQQAYTFIENETDYNPRIHYYLADIHLKLNQYKEAEWHCVKGIDKTLHTDYEYIGYNLYVVLAKCLHFRNETDSALHVLNEALTGLKLNTDQNSIAMCLNAMGEIYLDKSEYDKALEYFTEELIIQENTLNKNGTVISGLNIAFCYAKLHQLNLANIFLQKSISNLGNIIRNRDVLMKVYYKIAVTSEAINNSTQALVYFKKYYGIKDSLIGIENLRQINRLQAEYASEKKEKTIQLQQSALEKQNLSISQGKSQLIALVFIFITVVLLVILFYSRYQSKQKIVFLTEVQRLENSKILALKEKEDEERIRISRNIHDELGSGISKIYLMAEGTLPLIGSDQKAAENIKTLSKTAKSLSENMRDLVWSMDPENNTVDNLIAKMHEFCSDFFEELPIKILYDIPDFLAPTRISKESQRNIFLVFKESLNNIVKHANATQVSIRVVFENAELKIEINDNGNGFNTEQVRKTSNGLKNMINRMSGIGGNLKLESTSSGTSVVIQYVVPDPS